MPKKKTKAKRKAKNTVEPIDYAQPLKNRLWEAFSQNLVNGEGVEPTGNGGFTVKEISATDAYCKAGYKATASAARRNASRLLTNADITGRIGYLREQQAEMLARMGVASKEEVCQVLSSMLRAKHSDFLSMGDDGVTMFDIGEDTLNQSALKKIKTRIQRDEHGNVMIERQFDEIELESKIGAAKALSDIMGYNKSDENDEKSVNIHKEFLDALLADGPEVEHNPQNG